MQLLAESPLALFLISASAQGSFLASLCFSTKPMVALEPGPILCIEPAQPQQPHQAAKMLMPPWQAAATFWHPSQSRGSRAQEQHVTLPVSETSCQDWPCHCGSSRVVGLWELLKARYRPPPAPSASVHATSRDSSDQSAAYGCMPCQAMVLPSTYELLLSSLCCLLQPQSQLSNSMRSAP